MYRPSASDSLAGSRIFIHRIAVLILCVLMGMGVLILRYSYLQIATHERYKAQSDSNRIKLISDPPSRGYIYDRNGYLLADNQPVFSAILSPDELDDPLHTLELLAPIFNLTQEDMVNILAKIDKDGKDPITLKFDLTEEEIAKFSERKPFFRGVTIDTKLTRVYPHDELFAHVIGYVGRINDKESKRLAENIDDKRRYAGTDLIGKLGIEAQYENVLLGLSGYQSVETNVHGDVLRKLESSPATAGNDLYLSIDYGLQKIAQQQLAGRRGAIVAIDPKNGEVLAFVSNPSYDPNPFVSGISFKDYDALKEDPNQPLYNRALQGLYPPASTIKPFEAMGFLHYGIMDWDSTIFDPGYFSLPGDSHRFRDWKKGGHGIVDMTKSIVMSVDTYYYKTAYQLGIDRLHDWMTSFGFGQKTGIDLPHEKAGIMPSPRWKQETYNKDWLPGETISVSIGQGTFLASPLQVANATAMVANQGQHLIPHLLKRADGALPVNIISKPDGKIAFNGKNSDWLKMHNALEETIKRGTGRGIYTSQYRIAGKTGTAQVKSIAQGQRYNKQALSSRHWDHAWFTGFAPVDDPQIALAVIVENGGGGGSVAAPIGRALFDYWILRRHNNPLVPPSNDELARLRAEKHDRIRLQKETQAQNQISEQSRARR